MTKMGGKYKNPPGALPANQIYTEICDTLRLDLAVCYV